MKRMISISIFLLFLLTLSAAAEERHLQAAVPGEARTIALRALPESATLGLGIVGLLALRLRRKK